MRPQKTTHEKRMRLLYGLLLAPIGLALVLSPIVAGLQLMGALSLPAGLFYGLVLPMTVLFGVCMFKFPWDTKIITILCCGSLFALSFFTLKHIQQKRQRSLEGQSASAPSAAARSL